MYTWLVTCQEFEMEHSNNNIITNSIIIIIIMVSNGMDKYYCMKLSLFVKIHSQLLIQSLAIYVATWQNEKSESSLAAEGLSSALL